MDAPGSRARPATRPATAIRTMRTKGKNTKQPSSQHELWGDEWRSSWSWAAVTHAAEL